MFWVLDESAFIQDPVVKLEVSEVGNRDPALSFPAPSALADESMVCLQCALPACPAHPVQG